MHQVGNPKGEPMSKGQNLPANTKIKKSELKEIIKNFNRNNQDYNQFTFHFFRLLSLKFVMYTFIQKRVINRC